MDFFWPARGPVIDGGKLTEPVVGIEINGLPYCTWDQFQAIRWAIQQSHQMGRNQAVLYCGIHGHEVAATRGKGLKILHLIRSASEAKIIEGGEQGNTSLPTYNALGVIAAEQGG